MILLAPRTVAPRCMPVGCTGTGPTALSWALSAANRRCRADRDPVTSKRTATSAAPDGDGWGSTTRPTHPRPSAVCMTSCPGTHLTTVRAAASTRPEIRARVPSGRRLVGSSPPPGAGTSAWPVRAHRRTLPAVGQRPRIPIGVQPHGLDRRGQGNDCRRPQLNGLIGGLRQGHRSANRGELPITQAHRHRPRPKPRLMQPPCRGVQHLLQHRP